MTKPIENNDNARDFWGHLSDATALTSEVQVALTSKIGAATAAQVIREVPVFTKACWSRNSNQSSGITSMTTRKKYVANCEAKDLKLVFQNAYAETSGVSVVTVKAAIEDDLGVITPVLFSGGRTATVAVDGSLTISDPVAGVTIGKGRSYFVRVYSSWTSGNQYLNVILDNSVFPGDGRIDSVDRADSGVVTTTTNYGFGCNMVLGTPTKHNPLPTVGFLGDSIMDLVNTGGYSTGFDDNWTVSALGYEQGRNYPYIRMALGGSTAATVANVVSTKRRRFWSYPDIVICNLGLNDCRASTSAATTMANLQIIYRELLAGGVREIYQCTITPDTSASAQEAIRVALNTLIRAVPNPLTGVFESADAMETSRNSGIWNVGYNAADNYHPNNTGGGVLRDLLREQLFTQR